MDEVSSKLHGTYYIDPETGFKVLTTYFLKKRGSCCNSDCRHCPYKTEGQKEENNGSDK